MNRKTTLTIGIVVGLVVISGAIMAFAASQNNKPAGSAAQSRSENSAMMKQDEGTSMMRDEAAAASMSAEDNARMSQHGDYISLDAYNKEPAQYAQSKRVYFFHAAWCPICRGIDSELQSEMSKIPAGVTIIKTDFDSATDLRQKYGVTTQYSFVQVDGDGNETAQWSANSAAKALEGIR